MWIDFIFGPLDISYCIFFYILSSIGVIFGVFLLLIIVIYPIILKNTKEIFFLLFLYFILYFENRILYNMCINKTHILEGATVKYTNTELDANKRDTEVSNSVLSDLLKTSTAWNTLYNDIQTNTTDIENQLNIIYKNTKPIQYKQVTNIVNK